VAWKIDKIRFYKYNGIYFYKPTLSYVLIIFYNGGEISPIKVV